MRRELKRLCNSMKGLEPVAEFLGTSYSNVRVMRHRGFLSVELAERAEKRSGGEYQARLLAKKGAIK